MYQFVAAITRARSLLLVYASRENWKGLDLWLYIWGVERDSASERIKPDKFAFGGRSEIGIVLD